MPGEPRVERAEAIGAFLEPKLKHLSDPFLLPNMDRAVERLFRAREKNEPLVIFGDYDVDGVTSTALLTETLRALGWIVNFYLPHRMEEGYGLSQDGVENCLRKHPVTLLVAVDCGSTAVEAIEWLRARAWMCWCWTITRFPHPRRRGGAGESAVGGAARWGIEFEGAVFRRTGIQAGPCAGEARARGRVGGSPGI